MGLGTVVNGRQQVITPRNGKAWCDTVNSTPLPAQPTRSVLAIGSCNADGSGFKPYDKPIERKVALWMGDYRL